MCHFSINVVTATARKLLIGGMSIFVGICIAGCGTINPRPTPTECEKKILAHPGESVLAKYYKAYSSRYYKNENDARQDAIDNAKKQMLEDFNNILPHYNIAKECRLAGGKKGYKFYVLLETGKPDRNCMKKRWIRTTPPPDYNYFYFVCSSGNTTSEDEADKAALNNFWENLSKNQAGLPIHILQQRIRPQTVDSCWRLRSHQEQGFIYTVHKLIRVQRTEIDDLWQPSFIQSLLDQKKLSDVALFRMAQHVTVKVSPPTLKHYCQVAPVRITISSSPPNKNMNFTDVLIIARTAQKKRRDIRCNSDGKCSIDGLNIDDFPVTIDIPLARYHATLPSPLANMPVPEIKNLLGICPCNTKNKLIKLLIDKSGIPGTNIANIRISEPTEGNGDAVGPLVVTVLFRNDYFNGSRGNKSWITISPDCLQVIIRGIYNDWSQTTKTDTYGRAVFQNIPLQFFPLYISIPALKYENRISLPDVGVKLLMYHATRLINYNRDYSRAIEILNDIIRQRPNFGFAYFHRGLAKYHMEQYEPAIKDYTIAINFNPSFAKALMSRAGAYLQINRYQEAITDFTQAINANPDDPNLDCDKTEAYRFRGLLYFQLGETIKACRDLRISCDRGNTKACEDISDYCQ